MNTLFTEEETKEVRRAYTKTPETKLSKPEIPAVDIYGFDRLLATLNIYKNPLLNEASELLGILISIPRLKKPKNIEKFRQSLLESLAKFRKQGRLLDFHSSIIEKSCFVICAALDEAILSTDWGKSECWDNSSLLSISFKERNGGEVFFVLLEKAMKQPTILSDFIELQYILMMLGFQSKYRYRDEKILQQIKRNVYEIIYRNTEIESRLVSPITVTTEKVIKPTRLINMKLVTLLVLLSVCAGYGISDYFYNIESQSIIKKIDNINKQSDAIVSGNITASELYYKNKTTNQWEILYGQFSEMQDAKHFIALLDDDGYKAYTRRSGKNIEVVSSSSNNLPMLKSILNELNFKFDVNAVIRRANK
ncbi:DotU family type IV/VI secretion system protein [Parashewanella spongiae]|uniref:DotU family type IV/VI secretion system protein n=1 Tax=Parashewanella spongiae TaxID=342950 RepID=A0A3A6TSW6_9GAMM|nr:type IVB secretion system protein IcmH/DotU [Parashewanella spongiae]MCL1076790.1 type IVB secretion system protein IcmH/DotU [Parashewanella spongiae]RJY19285.1 DotU family type IV/VI secretion system protein [Parashewanella spongiae]